jgi:ATP-dependent Clp protease adaptor protein ClpS
MAPDEKKPGEDQGQTKTLERQDTRAEKPRMFRVILHNDDYTTMEFVVEVLIEIFRKSAAQAVQLMLLVHTVGKATVGLYTREVAETRCADTERRARERGFPLKATLEPENP